MMLPVAMSDHVAMSDRDDLDRAAEVYRGFRFALTKRGYRSGRRSSRTVGVVDADVLDGQHRLVAVGRATRSTAPLQKCHAPEARNEGSFSPPVRHAWKYRRRSRTIVSVSKRQHATGD